MMRPRRFGSGLAALFSGLLLLAACGPNQPSEARRDLILGIQLEPPNLDPTSGGAAAIDEIVYANVFEGLTRIGPAGEVLPGLAESWASEEGGLSYVFKLRAGVTFHDGTAFDAADVKFTFERINSAESSNAQKALYAPFAAVEAIDPLTVRFTLARPIGNLLFNLGYGDAVIVAPESAETNATLPVGTGPFRFADWREGDRIELVRNESYWGEPTQLEKAVFRVIPDPAAAYSALLAGDIDGFPNYPAPENLKAFEAEPRFKVVVGTTEGETILAINNRRAPLDKREVRQALAFALDRQAIIDAAMFGYGVPIGSHFAPHHAAYTDLTGLYPHNPEEARRLLAAAGAVPGLKLRLALPPPSYARRGGEVVQAQLKAVGIETEIIPMEWAQWLDQVLTNKDFDLTIVAHTEPLDIDIYARDDYYFGYRNPAFQALIATIDQTSDEAERTRLYGAAQRIIAEDAVNAFLFQIPKLGVADARLEGLWVNSPIQANDLTGVTWRH